MGLAYMTHPAWGVRIVVDNDPQMAPILLRRRQVQYSLKERRNSVGPRRRGFPPFSSPAHAILQRVKLFGRLDSCMLRAQALRRNRVLC